MEKQKEDELIRLLKNGLLDLLVDEKNLFLFEYMVEKMCELIEKVIGADEVNFYFCPDWQDELILEGILLEETPKVKLTNRCSCVFSQKAFPYPHQRYLITDDDRTLGYIMIKGPVEFASPNQLTEQIGRECGRFLKKVAELSKIAAREKKYSLLFRVTEKFYSSMDMDTILEEMLSVLQEVYPNFQYSLFLSQDIHSKRNLPIKGLQYDNQNVAAMDAYVNGTVQIEKNVLYAPLKGIQGVYGVVQITVLNTHAFPKNEVEFISLFVNAAGKALENAKLYEQSKKLVADLKLINEVSHRLNSKQRFTDTVCYLCEQILASFDADEVGFILFKEGQKKANILEGSTSFFYTDGAKKYIDYFQKQIFADKSSILIGDFNGLNDKQYRSIMVVPMIQTGVIEGFIIVMHKEAYHFSFDMYKLLQSLIHHSTLAFVNSKLREELEKMVITDYLTKLYTRNYLDQQIQKSMKDDGQGTFLLFDIDNFKGVNDAFGHQTGDDILIQVANIMRSSIRDADIAARWGGEELAIYLPNVPLESGVAIANRVKKRVMERTNPPVTVSCGVSHWDKCQEETVKEIFNRADQALYEAKSTGKNKVVIQNETCEHSEKTQRK
jgi:diguanylate cyclase (GGDEF)-like protein